MEKTLSGVLAGWSSTAAAPGGCPPPLASILPRPRPETLWAPVGIPSPWPCLRHRLPASAAGAEHRGPFHGDS